MRHLARPASTVAGFVLALLLALGATPASATVDDAEPLALPPGIPSDSAAQTQLDALTVQPEEEEDSYDRSLFPHWVNVEDNCTARQYVLLRDGSDVQTDDSCQPTSGTWFSEFDGETTSDIPNTHVDHLVALAEAWRSGAHDWSTAEREEFANDVASPQLWAVTASSNISKGDHDPANWMPPRTEVRCDYTKSWINVKYRYDLAADQTEADALQGQLDTYC